MANLVCVFLIESVETNRKQTPGRVPCYQESMIQQFLGIACVSQNFYRSQPYGLLTFPIGGVTAQLERLLDEKNLSMLQLPVTVLLPGLTSILHWVRVGTSAQRRNNLLAGHACDEENN